MNITAAPAPTAANTWQAINGFPAYTCGRCAGAGVIAEYRHVDAGECFTCKGKGLLVVPEHAAGYEAYTAAVKQAREVAYGDVQVGDELIYHGCKRFVVAVGPAAYDSSMVEIVTRSGMRAYGAPTDMMQRYVDADSLPRASDFLS